MNRIAFGLTTAGVLTIAGVVRAYAKTAAQIAAHDIRIPQPDSPIALAEPDTTRSHLLPYMQQQLAEVEARIRAKGLNCAFYEGFRGRVRQADAVARGVSRAGPWQGFHNYGAAVDFVFRTPNGSWTWDANQPWAELGGIYESVGLEWGGRWQGFYDGPHGQTRAFGSRTDLQFASWLARGSKDLAANIRWTDWFQRMALDLTQPTDRQIGTAIAQRLLVLAGRSVTVDGAWGAQTANAADSPELTHNTLSRLISRAV